MTAPKSTPRIPTTGNTFAELCWHLSQVYMSGSCGGREDWPTVPHMLACALVPISRKLHRLAEDECNRPAPTEHYFAAKRGKLIRQASSMLPESIKARAKTDPRAGYGLGLIFPDGRTNDFGGTCVIVPTKVTE